jgi:hypothetical protein
LRTKDPALAAEAARKSSPEVAKIDSAIAQVENYYRKELAGSAVTDSEAAFIDRALNRQMGSSPAERLLALRVIADATNRRVQAAYAPLGAVMRRSPKEMKGLLQDATDMEGFVLPRSTGSYYGKDTGRKQDSPASPGGSVTINVGGKRKIVPSSALPALQQKYPDLVVE